MGRVTPLRESQLTCVTKSYGDAICHCVNCWGGWPLQTLKSSKTDRILRGRLTYGWKQVDSPFISLALQKPKQKRCETWCHCQSVSVIACKAIPSKKKRKKKKLLVIGKKHGKNSQLPSSLCKFQVMCLFCSVAQSRRVGMSMVIKSRLCNWHHRVGCGWIHLPRAGGHDTDVPGSLSFGVSDRRRQPADAFHVGITACSNIETKTSARLCGKIQLWVSWSLNVSLKVNWCLKFISSDNIFCPKTWAAVFSVLPTRSLNRHLLKIAACKISCCNNCSCRCTEGEYFHV